MEKEKFTEGQRLKRCAELMNKFYAQGLTASEFEEFSDHAMRACTVGFSASVKEMYGKDFNYPKIAVDTSLTTLGGYASFFQTIYLAPHNDSYCRDKLLANHVNTIGHEFSHHAQHKLAELKISPEMEEWVKAASEDMAGYISEVQISEQELEKMDRMDTQAFGKSILEEENLSTFDKNERYKSLAFCSYMNLYYKDHARDCGYDFSKKFYDKITPYMRPYEQTYKDFLLDKFYVDQVAKREFESGQEHAAEYKAFKGRVQGQSASVWREIENEKINPLRNEIDAALSDMSNLTPEQFQDLNSKILEFDKQERTLKESLKILYKDCPAKQVYEDFLLCLDKENVLCAQGILNSVKENPLKNEYSKALKEQIGETLTTYFKTQIFTKRSCEIDLTEFVSTEQVWEISKSLLAQGKSALAFEFFGKQTLFQTKDWEDEGEWAYIKSLGLGRMCSAKRMQTKSMLCMKGSKWGSQCFWKKTFSIRSPVEKFRVEHSVVGSTL